MYYKFKFGCIKIKISLLIYNILKKVNPKLADKLGKYISIKLNELVSKI